VSMSIGH